MTDNGAGSTTWQVRAPHYDDLRRWRELHRAYADSYRTSQPDAAAQQVWSWIHHPHHELNCLLAADETGYVAGLAHYRAFARPLSASTGSYLDDLFVDPAHRGSGVADAVLIELLYEARSLTASASATSSR